jgi:hypothetical protein
MGKEEENIGFGDELGKFHFLRWRLGPHSKMYLELSQCELFLWKTLFSSGL